MSALLQPSPLDRQPETDKQNHCSAQNDGAANVLRPTFQQATDKQLTIPVFKPLIEQDEIAAATGALEMGWLGMGSYVGQFEQAVKEYLGCEDRHVAALSTGHAALHLAMLLAGVGPGDEVITPSFNNAADFQAILATGATPVFCDVDEETLCIDLEKAAQVVTPHTKAVIVMDYDCILCDHDAVAAFAEAHNLRVIHDAAHAFGSEYRGRKVGAFSDITMFSFDPVKTLTCIDGGMLIVKTEEELQAIHEMRLVGMCQPAKVMYTNARAWTYDLRRLGFRYHMANLHAAIGLSQLAKIDLIASTRREACRTYNRGLSDIPQVRVPNTDFADVTPFLYYIRVPAGDRDGLRAFLSDRGIDTGIHWQPGHWFSLLKDYPRGDLSVTDRIGNEVLSLPLHSCMEQPTIERVIDGIRAFFHH
jgi:dTDP-4-amino-4,6-dideoxygalactose transaminase